MSDLSDMINGYKLKRDYEFNLHIQSLRVTRWVGWLIHSVNVKKSHHKPPEKLLKLPGDIKIPQKPLLTKDQFLRAKAIGDKIIGHDGKSRNVKRNP